MRAECGGGAMGGRQRHDPETEGVARTRVAGTGGESKDAGAW